MTAFSFFSREKERQAEDKVILGVTKIENSTLMYMADALGKFRDNGLDVTLKEYPSGLKAVDALREHDNDLTVCAEFVFVLKSFEQNDLKFIGTIARANNHEFIVRKDRGIQQPSDLKGKKVAVTLKTSGDFFFETFLSFQNIRIQDVQIINTAPDKIPESISSSLVDAACTWSPFVEQSKKLLGENAVSWAAQSGQDYYWLLVTTNEFVKNRPKTAERILKALLDTERFMSENPEESRTIMGQKLNFDPAMVKAAWERCDFRVRLDQNLLTLMDDESRWIIRRKKVNTTEMPNFFKRMDFNILESIKPEAVSIIH